MKQTLLQVSQAWQKIHATIKTTSRETISIAEANQRYLAQPIHAKRQNPPFNASAMDGFALNSKNTKNLPQTLKIIGQSTAGKRFQGTIQPGQCVRIFTGAVLPDGADTIIIQENVTITKDKTGKEQTIQITTPGPPNAYIRPAGFDFANEQKFFSTGHRLSPTDCALLAAMNTPWIEVFCRPQIAILANGNELTQPGEKLEQDCIISSNVLGLCALTQQLGGQPRNLGIAGDDKQALIAAIGEAKNCDLLVTIGGASVGQYDLVEPALSAKGLKLDFWRIAMRPGKPLLFGHLNAMPVLGLPGNPVSSMVCAWLFLAPAIRAMTGVTKPEPKIETAILAHNLPQNDHRQEYMRATITTNQAGRRYAHPFAIQDSAMLALLAQADCLVIRPPHAPPAKKGDEIPILPLRDAL